MITIRPFLRSETELVMKSIDQIWKKGHILSRDPQLLEYMFYSLPNRRDIFQEEEYAILGAFDGEKVVGLLGAMPFAYHDGDERGICVTLANWIVDVKYQQRGVGLKLLETIMTQPDRLDAIIVSGMSAEAKRLYELMRWYVQPNLPRWIGVPNLNELKESLSLVAEKELINPENYRGEPFCKVKQVNTLEEESWDHFYYSMVGKKTSGITRNASYLKWRYFDHPTFIYHVFVAMIGNRYVGLTVLRNESIEGGKKVGRIVEMIYDNDKVADELIKQVLLFTKDVLFLDFFTSNDLMTGSLERVGFFKESSHNSFPSRFQPLDFKVSTIDTAIYRRKDNKNPLYLTKGDADQDRPN